ncbi:MAG: dicarboxylate/amino acid:cation symporter [Bacteroidales bacterium]|nr:dicarboxylate/amino acid:cation symporter [Bacteroidales bacterium]
MKIPKIGLHWQILIALVFGLLYGIFLTSYVEWVEWMGDIFLRALRMIIIPLILTSIITGITQVESGSRLGKLGLKTLTYYIVTSTIAILTGLVLVNIFKPGVGADLGFTQVVDGLDIEAGSFGKTLIEIIPTNLFEAFAEGKMLSVIFFALLFGYFITRIGEKDRAVMDDFFKAAFEVVMKITMLIIRFTPFGVFGIIAGNISHILVDQGGGMQALIDVGSRLGLYMITVFLGLSIHAFITLPLIQKFLARVHPLKHFRAVSTPLITAFSTSSALATLPLTLEAVEHNDGVSNKVSSFTLPLGATMNMDGTALYECVAAMFIAQAYGLELDISQQVIIVITALIASIGAAAVPMAGLFMIAIILSAIGLPLEGIGLIVAVDRILDMFRTATNVWSDTTGALVIARSEGETLKV